MIINEYVKDFRGCSFYMENELICGMIMFFSNIFIWMGIIKHQ